MKRKLQLINQERSVHQQKIHEEKMAEKKMLAEYQSEILRKIQAKEEEEK